MIAIYFCVQSMKHPVHSAQYPLEIEIADGLDGSGSHRIYNQISDNPNFTNKNFLLFAFKVLSIKVGLS